MKTNRAIVAAIAAMLVPSAVAGATITYTLVQDSDSTNDDYWLPLFDAQLGKLQSVSLDLHAWDFLTFPVLTFQEPTRLDIGIGATYASFGRIGDVDFAVQMPAVDAVFYFGPWELTDAHIRRDGYASRTYTTGLDPFVGVDPAFMPLWFHYQPFSFHFSTEGSIEDCIRQCSYFGGEATVTYHYAVPEPASWIMMLGGLALTGGALRARRRSVSYFFASDRKGGRSVT